jgi:ribbon-helix-helix CopG family protein
MAKPPRIARISITIPSDLLKAADRLAREQDRSRSWVLGEGVRRMTSDANIAAAPGPVLDPYAGFEDELEAERLGRLAADLAMTPEERLARAEEMTRVARIGRPARNRAQVIGFDSHEEYDRWKATRVGGIGAGRSTARLCAALNAADVRYLLVGDAAAVLHGQIRPIGSVGILIERTLENVARVLYGLEGLGYGFAITWPQAEVLAKPVTVIGSDPAIELFTVAWRVEFEDAVKRSHSVEAEDVVIPMVGLDDLIATRRTGRPRDTADLGALEEIRRMREEGR